MLEKFIWALKILLEKPEYKNITYFIRTNSSTFVNMDLLNKYITHLPEKKCFAGSLQDLHNGFKFVKGTCMIFSRDMAEELVKADISKLKYWKYDDIILTYLMKKKHIKPHEIPDFNLISDTVPYESELKEKLAQFPLIRIKNPDRKNDLKIWSLCSKIGNGGGYQYLPELTESQIQKLRKTHKTEIEPQYIRDLKEAVKKIIFPSRRRTR